MQIDWVIVFFGVLQVFILTLPWTIPRWIEPFLYRRSVKKARAELAKAGLTPEQYIATINPKNSFAVLLAKVRFGVE